MSGLFIEAPKNILIESFDKRKVKSIMQLVGYARQLHFSYPNATVIDLHNVLRTKVLRSVLRLFGHKTYRLIKPRRDRMKLTSRSNGASVPPLLYITKMTDLYEDLLKRAGMSFSYPIETIIPGYETLERITIGVAPHAQHRGKRIGREKTIELIKALQKHFYDCQVILYGAPGDETEENKEIIRHFDGDMVRLTGGKGLMEEVEEIAHLHCMISGDSANQHIAAMVGTPVISVWGATHPAGGFLPFGMDEDQCYGVDLDCRPCSIFGKKDCRRGDWACLKQLRMEVVAQKVADLIRNNKARAE